VWDQRGSPYWVWDRSRLIFLVDRRPAEGRPEWIVVQESPLPNTMQGLVQGFLNEGYTFVQAFNALSLKDERIYDRQDAFSRRLPGSPASDGRDRISSSIGGSLEISRRRRLTRSPPVCYKPANPLVFS